MKCTIKNFPDDNDDINLALLQMRSIPIGTGLSSPVTALFNMSIRALLPQTNMEAINFNTDNEYYEAL